MVARYSHVVVPYRFSWKFCFFSNYSGMMFDSSYSKHYASILLHAYSWGSVIGTKWFCHRICHYLVKKNCLYPWRNLRYLLHILSFYCHKDHNMMSVLKCFFCCIEELFKCSQRITDSASNAPPTHYTYHTVWLGFVFHIRWASCSLSSLVAIAICVTNI